MENTHTGSELIGPHNLLKESWVSYKKNLQKIKHIFLLPFILSLVSQFILILLQFVTNTEKYSEHISILFILAIVSVIFSVFYNLVSLIGFIKHLSEDSADQNIDLKKLRENGKKLLWPFVIVSFIGSMVSIALLPLLILPAIIMQIYLGFSAYALIIDGKKGFESVTTSFHYVRDRGLKVFGRYAYIILILILGSIILGILTSILGGIMGSSKPDENGAYHILSSKDIFHQTIFVAITNIYQMLLATPLILIYFYGLYVNLKKIKAGQSVEQLQSRTKLFRILFTIGIFFVIIAFILSLIFIPILMLTLPK